jgi:hypothetical protein
MLTNVLDLILSLPQILKLKPVRICQYNDNQSSDDSGQANTWNVIKMKYISDNGQYLI